MIASRRPKRSPHRPAVAGQSVEGKAGSCWRVSRTCPRHGAVGATSQPGSSPCSARKSCYPASATPTPCTPFPPWPATGTGLSRQPATATPKPGYPTNGTSPSKAACNKPASHGPPTPRPCLAVLEPGHIAGIPHGYALHLQGARHEYLQLTPSWATSSWQAIQSGGRSAGAQLVQFG